MMKIKKTRQEAADIQSSSLKKLTIRPGPQRTKEVSHIQPNIVPVPRMLQKMLDNLDQKAEEAYENMNPELRDLIWPPAEFEE